MTKQLKSDLSPSVIPGDDTCPSCQSSSIETIYEVSNVPTNSCLLFDEKEQALNCPTNNIRLVFCDDCGFVYNAEFISEATEYSDKYEETQGFSPTFSSFHTQLAQDLITKHDLIEKNIVEIGCGKGEFLILLSQLGRNECVGIDPSAISERIKGVDGAERVKLVPEYYRKDHDMDNVDFVACKMTLEHIPDVQNFLTIIRDSLGEKNDPVVFFQVPEAERILKTGAFEDIYHEHCSYFSPGSLSRAFRRCGFDVLSIDKNYDDQYLTIECRPTQNSNRQTLPDSNDIDELRALVETFPERIAEVKAHWKHIIQTANEKGQTIALWGSGSKAVSFLTSLDVGNEIDCVVDINPHRANHYMPRTGQKIVAPDALVEIQPDLVVIMNRIYEAEITNSLHEKGLFPDILCL